jgi:hypothetical protein
MTLGDKIMEDSWNKGKDVVQVLQGAGAVRAAKRQADATKELVKLNKKMVDFNGKMLIVSALLTIATIIYAFAYVYATFLKH